MSILDALTPYKIVAEIVVIGSLAAGAMWCMHEFLEHERQIGRDEVQARWNKQTADDEKKAQAQEKVWATQKDTAITDGAKRDETIRNLAAAVAANANGLRNAVDKINGNVPGYSADALRDITRTYGELLTECSTRRREVASTAEKLNSEKRTLIEAWPKPKQTKSE